MAIRDVWFPLQVECHMNMHEYYSVEWEKRTRKRFYFIILLEIKHFLSHHPERGSSTCARVGSSYCWTRSCSPRWHRLAPAEGASSPVLMTNWWRSGAAPAVEMKALIEPKTGGRELGAHQSVIKSHKSGSQLGVCVFHLGGGSDMLYDNHLCPHIAATWVQPGDHTRANGRQGKRGCSFGKRGMVAVNSLVHTLPYYLPNLDWQLNCTIWCHPKPQLSLDIFVFTCRSYKSQ